MYTGVCTLAPASRIHESAAAPRAFHAVRQPGPAHSNHTPAGRLRVTLTLDPVTIKPLLYDSVLQRLSCDPDGLHAHACTAGLSSCQISTKPGTVLRCCGQYVL